MTDHYGIISDNEQSAHNKKIVATSAHLKLCDRCNGTGNEFYAMYRRCYQCKGAGVLERKEQ